MLEGFLILFFFPVYWLVGFLKYNFHSSLLLVERQGYRETEFSSTGSFFAVAKACPYNPLSGFLWKQWLVFSTNS